MHLAHPSTSNANHRGDLHTSDTTYHGRFAGQLGVLIGLSLLVCIAIAYASLATWSVDDPSLSNANGRMVQNAAGFWGASFADLVMQFTGLASVVLLSIPAIWAWLKIVQKPIGRIRRRLMAWPVAVILSAGVLACLPIAEKWPLPSGLGGIFGDLILSIPAFVLGGYPSGIWASLFFLVLIGPALIAVLYASGLINRGVSTASDEFSFDPETGEVLDDTSSSGWLIGALTHFWLSTRALMRRRNRKTRNIAKSESNTQRSENAVGLLSRIAIAWNRLTTPPDDGLEEFAPDYQREPGFEDSEHRFEEDRLEPELSGGDFLRAPDTTPAYGETIYAPVSLEDDEAGAHATLQDTAKTSNGLNGQGRITPPAPQPKQGSRVIREAQPSLLSDDSFALPHLSYLGEAKITGKEEVLSTEALEANARLLEGVLEDFGVKGEIINVRPGPVVTLYELEPAPGIKSSRVIGLADDIARSMSAIACRVAVVPGRNAIGIELPNQNRETVYLKEILSAKDYEKTRQKLALVLGKTIGGEPVIADLAKMPHLLVAGTTGSGKSVAINTMILSILYRLTPEQVKLIMIDPKMLELSIYDGIPHLLTPVVTDPKKAVVALKWTVREMEDRYKKMSKLGVRNIDGFNQRLEQARKKGETLTRTVQTGFNADNGEAIFETEELNLEPMPYIVVIIDEMADLMMVAGKEIEGAIQRLAQMARAAGIHVIMATQRPSVDVITGTIKANFPTRISFQVTSKIDSRTILGEQGAEQLLGMGDMLYMAGGGRIQRVHGPFVADDEVEKIVAHLKSQGVPRYLEAVTSEEEEETSASGQSDNPLSESNDIYDQAVAVVLRDRKVSTSYIQRRLGIGYNRAASLIERMENEGLIGAANHAGKREILVPAEDETI